MGKEKESGKSFANKLEGRRREEVLESRVTFAEYLEMVSQNPELARNAHQYVRDAILSFGVEKDENGEIIYKLFSSEPDPLYGVEETIQKMMRYYQSAAEGGNAHFQILLLVGPPGGGKSTINKKKKAGLEAYSRTDEGARYVVEGCNMWCNPLVLVPNDLRNEFFEEFGIHIEGHPCPKCQKRFAGDDWQKQVVVKRQFFSEQSRAMIGTWKASDEKSQEVGELIGSINLRGLAEHGIADHPEAYNDSGEFNKSNRGLLELEEVLQAGPKILVHLKSMATEKNFKYPGFAVIHSDVAMSAHTNEGDYIEKLVQPKTAEGLRRRFYVIDAPLVTRLDAEMKIHSKLLEPLRQRGLHISPDTCWVTAMWSILTRLNKSNKADPLSKLRLYNREEPETVFGTSRGGVTAQELKDDAPREGMQGVPPTYVGTTLGMTEAKNCLNAVDALLMLQEGLDANIDTRHLSADEKTQVLDHFNLVRQKFNEHAISMVNRAFVSSFEPNAQAMFRNYLENVKAYDQGRKQIDPDTKQEFEPNEKFMRSLEERIPGGPSESGKKEFRRQLLADRGSREGDDRNDYHSYPGFKEAIEKKLSADMKGSIDYIESEIIDDPDRSVKRHTVLARLVEDHGYCPHCASHLIRYVKRLQQGTGQ